MPRRPLAGGITFEYSSNMEKTPTNVNSQSTKLYIPRLTPTGKISHAKTRVYTQRYRKEWENMSDFKGWLTSVPLQPTRAYCKYCKKDLHAHRLSLLKHTCTMKHQRAALLLNSGGKIMDNVRTEEETEEVEDDSEFLVERLDLEDDDAMDTQDKLESEELHLSDEDEHKPVIKKIKLNENMSRDTLAEAMAHVTHDEYLEVDNDNERLELDMVVEEETSNTEIEVILPDTINDEAKEKSKELENRRVTRRSLKAIDKTKPTSKILQADGKGDMIVASLPVLETAYQLNNTIVSTHDANIIQPVTAAQNRTITLTSGGKTLTLTGGTFQPGTQYVLSKIKGAKLPTLVVSDKKPIVAVNSPDVNKTVQLTTVLESTSSTSQQDNKSSPKSTPKKLRISTQVMDITKGVPINGLQVSLYKLVDGRWTFMNESNTNSNGRCVDLLDHSTKSVGMGGRYKIHLDVDKYFTLRRIETMYPFIEVVFDVKNPLNHYHIPVLLSPFGYSTYRGS
ncbi:PREDICTED: uncharacterized protein LOC106749040 isoform X2 [Dinoponera quadriceps]|uniref:hydroxyisourate hydrolase n=1 Tax=Dinoponera quadriceps TaxID=609295 RepID=A0A6P3Y020_DINQU|nr:PREDICTED: uncharacterized protein LOC106749040 isoform X2 [Dinoponera quadriceps]